MTKFHQYKAAAKLKDLALDPLDLTFPETLTARRLEEYAVQGPEYKLIYATQRVDSEVLTALAELAKEAQAIEMLRKMQSGEILNKIEGVQSENRAVLHTATRDFFDNPNQGQEAKKAREDALKEQEKLKKFLSSIEKSTHYTDIVLVGIGGSDLGPRSIYHALKAYRKSDRRVHFISNVDPDDCAEVLDGVELSKALIVIVSKSGSTLETYTNEQLVRDRFKQKSLNPKEHLIAVTGKGSPMDDATRYREIFYMWDYVGGRYSSTSMVGCVILGFSMGMDLVSEFLHGSHLMDQHALTADPLKNLPCLSALLGIWNRNFLNHPTLAIIPYSQALWRFPAHLQQCDMESNGKSIDRQGQRLDHATGPVVWGEPGTNGQHSFYQLIHQGTDIVPVEFIAFKESQRQKDLVVQGTTSQEKLLSNVLAQAIALAIGQKNDNPNKCFHGNRPSSLLLGKKLTARSMGALLAYYEHKVALQGFIWNINSFDQEGVQLGKVLATQVLQGFEAARQGKTRTQGFPIGEAFLKHLR